MRRDWNERAEENAYYWVESSRTNWDKEEYYRKGEEDVQRYVFPFFETKGISKEQLRQFHVLDIGCGTGRLCRALAPHVGSVTGVDIAEEMIARAKEDNADLVNCTFLQVSGVDLAPIDAESVDFCFSFIVFQHIPSKRIIRSYFQEMLRVLKPGGYAKIQVRGAPGKAPGRVVWFRGLDHFYIALILWKRWLPFPWIRRYDTVLGACFTAQELEGMLKHMGFDAIETTRETQRYLWVRIRKPQR